MDNLFVWIVMFAGAAIALLGMFLVASEKELKVKRREIEGLLTRLKNVPEQQSSAASATTPRDNSAEVAELRARNQDLQNQLNTVSGKLELGRRQIAELEATPHTSDNIHAETHELHAANDRLKAEVNQLRNLLQASEARVTGSAADNQDAPERHARLQSEMLDLKQRLEESQAKLREYESQQQKLATVGELEARHREERQRLESRIAELEKDVATRQEKVRELEILQDRLAESERNQETLRSESRRHEEEIARWRERIADGEEIRRRLASLQEPFQGLVAKQAALDERQHAFQEELATFARMIAAPAQEISPMSQASVQPHGAGAASPEKKRRFGIFSAVIVLAAAAVFAAQYMGPNASESTTPAVMASAPGAADRSFQPLKPSSSANTQPAVIKPSKALTAPVAKDAAKPAVSEKAESPKAIQIAKLEPRTAGTYEITQVSRVYAAPTEHSQLIGEIEPGVKVNVVNTRDGWLEIHSKHGRPPGFIRREVAARVAGRE